MGGGPEDGSGAESIPARGADTYGPGEEIVGGIPRV